MDDFPSPRAPPTPHATLDTPPSTQDHRPMSDATSPPTCGRMIIDLIDNGSARPVPRVSFDPVGRFTPAMMDHYLLLFANEIDKAQHLVRHAARQPTLDLPTTPARRRR